MHTTKNQLVNSHFSIIGTVLVIVGTLLFSLKSIAIQWLYQVGLEIEQLILMRMLIAFPVYCIIGIWALRSLKQANKPIPSTKCLLFIFSSGILCYHFASYLDMWALQHISAGLERITLMTFPLIVALIQHMRGERLNRYQWLCVGLAYVGIVLFYFEDASHYGGRILMGGLAVLVAAVFTALFSISSQHYSRAYSGTLFTALAMSVTALSISCHILLINPPELWINTTSVWMGTSFIAIGSTVLASLAFNHGIALTGATLGSMAGMIGPLLTMIISDVMLDAPLSAMHLFALAVVVTGVYGTKRLATSRCIVKRE